MLFLLLAFTAFTVSQHASNFVPFAAGGMAARMDAERRTGGKRVESSRVSRVFVKIFRLSSLRRLTRSNQRQAKNSTVQRNSQVFTQYKQTRVSFIQRHISCPITSSII